MPSWYQSKIKTSLLCTKSQNQVPRLTLCSRTGVLLIPLCVKIVLIQSYSGPYFPAFRLNTDQNNFEYAQFLGSAHVWTFRVIAINSIAVETQVFEMDLRVLTVIGEDFLYIKHVNDGN